jgi:hypothetical protein
MPAHREAYVVVLTRRNGKRHGERHELGVPIPVVRWQLERLSDLALREMANDITAEQARRTPTTP